MTTRTDGARAYLWELQAQIADAQGRRGRHANQRRVSALRELVDKLPPGEQPDPDTVEALRLQQRWPPCGPEESYHSHYIIHSLADRIEKYLPDPFIRPVLGSLDTGEINAVTLLAPDARTHLVIFESELFTFANLFSKAVAMAMPFEDAGGGRTAFSVHPDKVRRHLKHSPDAILRFADVVRAYLFEGEPSRARPYHAPHPIDVQAAILRDGLELFVLGHEYGHVLLDHLAESQSPRRVPGTADGELTEVTWKWKQEHDADTLGWFLCTKVMTEKYDLAFSHAGTELFFSACEVLERALSLLVEGRSEAHPASPTHPPIAERRDALRTLLRDERQGESAIILGTAIQDIVDILWEPTAPHLLGLLKRGQQPDPRWTANLTTL
ncbi:hypothetical protein [Streptomyces rimosus]|uniref:hypothetical protein n=1 Tax=Streptomyces rimosus TaxID=1927 RepID=UPI0037A7C31B